MNKLFTLGLLALMPLFTVQAQIEVTNEPHERVLSHIDNQVYEVKFIDNNGVLTQKGQYLKEGDKYIPHGVWTLFAYNTDEVITTTKYQKGEQIWVETSVNGETIRADKKALEIAKLQNRIAQLEQKINKLKENE